MIQIKQDFMKSIYKVKILLICNSRGQKDKNWGQTVENQWKNNSFYYFSIYWSTFVAEAWKFHVHEKKNGLKKCGVMVVGSLHLSGI